MIKDTMPGVVGNCTSGAAFGFAWITANTLPALHVFSILAGIIASVATASYYFVEWRNARKHRAAYYAYRAVKQKKHRRKK